MYIYNDICILVITYKCLSIYSCTEIPSVETCLPQLQSSFYAPGTFDSTGQVFSEFQEIIRRLDPLDICRAFISTVICVFRFPACNETRGTILPICRDICGLVDGIVNQCTEEQFFRNNPDFPAVNQLLDTFVCSEPQSYYNFPIQYIETDPNICSGFCKYIYIHADAVCLFVVLIFTSIRLYTNCSSASKYMFAKYMYIHAVHLFMSICVCVCISVCICMYIHIHIYNIYYYMLTHILY